MFFLLIYARIMGQPLNPTLHQAQSSGRRARVWIWPAGAPRSVQDERVTERTLGKSRLRCRTGQTGLWLWLAGRNKKSPPDGSEDGAVVLFGLA
jgi:hypothetical protein